MLAQLLITAVTGVVYDLLYTDAVNGQWVVWGVSGFGGASCCSAEYLYNAGESMALQGFLPVNNSYLLAWVGDPATVSQEKLLAVRKANDRVLFEDIIRGDTYRYFSIGKRNQPCLGQDNYTALYVRNDDRAKVYFGCLDITTGTTYPVSSHEDPYAVADQGGTGHFQYGGGIYDTDRHVMWSTWHQDIPPYSHVQFSINVDGTFFQEKSSQDPTYATSCHFTIKMENYPCIVTGTVPSGLGYWNTVSNEFVEHPSPPAAFVSFTVIPNTSTALAIDAAFGVYEVNLQTGTTVKQGVLTGTYLPAVAAGKLFSFSG